ncbi:hypothetical protein [Catellatospora sp. NPDC049133]|uniref:hypothetical protein n=1 Tax=Catellatospora sp. NPDC049133 TaxID=3155499 RepID=UPI0033CF04CD
MAGDHGRRHSQPEEVMGIDEKISNLSRRCAGRSMELVGKITHNSRWQLTGYTTWLSACDDAIREKAKDEAKAMAAVSSYWSTYPTAPETSPAAAVLERVVPADSPATAQLGTRPDYLRIPGGPVPR